MENQKEDKKGTTYGTGVALESDIIPSFIKRAKDKKKTLLGIKCSFMDSL